MSSIHLSSPPEGKTQSLKGKLHLALNPVGSEFSPRRVRPAAIWALKAVLTTGVGGSCPYCCWLGPSGLAGVGRGAAIAGCYASMGFGLHLKN